MVFFYARLVCVKGSDVFEIDSRTSDAIAMAVRFDCPIYTYEFILDAAGVILDDQEGEGVAFSDQDSQSKPSKEGKIETFSVEKLKKLLDKVLGDEDYEKAAQIRDEINKREAEE